MASSFKPETSVLPSHFVRRRVHSFLGLFPIGFFLIWHLFNYSKSLSPNGYEAYNKALQGDSLLPFGFLIEVLFIYLPLMLHVGYGFVILFQSKSNVTAYPTLGNFRYLLQRITGIFSLIFIGYHLFTVRLIPSLGGGIADYGWMIQSLNQNWKVLFYLIGTAAVCFHFANGLWTFLITWGITVSPHSQKISLRFWMSFFVVLTLINWLVIANFAYYAASPPLWLGMALQFVKEYLF